MVIDDGWAGFFLTLLEVTMKFPTVIGRSPG